MSALDQDANLHEYFQQSFQNQLAKQSEEQQYDATMLTPATRLLQKQREMGKVEEDLQTQKVEHDQRMQVLQQRKEALKEREQSLTASLLKFDHFLKENDARRKRALRKIHDELELCTQKDGQIETYRSELVELKKVKDQQRQGVAKQEFYEKYLRKVLQNTDEFSEINELIDRYVTLHLTNKDLVKLDNDCQARMDSLSKDQSRRQEEHRVRVLGYHTRLGELTSRKEKAEKETMYWEHQAQASEQSATKRTLLLGRIRMATANLYALVNAHTPGSGNLERIPVTEKQLDKIQVFIKDLEDVVAEFDAEFEDTSKTAANDHALTALRSKTTQQSRKNKKTKTRKMPGQF